MKLSKLENDIDIKWWNTLPWYESSRVDVSKETFVTITISVRNLDSLYELENGSSLMNIFLKYIPE